MKKGLIFYSLLICFSANPQWTLMPSGTTNNLDGIHFFDNQTGICSKSFANTIKTTDSGNSWSLTSSFGIRDFSFVDNNFGYGASAVGQSMSKTTDGGNNWTSITPPTSNSLWGVSATSSTTAHFVGTGGVYWYTTNGGTTVNVGNSGTIDLLTDIFFVSSTTGFLTVQTGEVKKTINGGSTWTTVHAITGGLLTEMHFVDQNIGYIAGSGGTIIKTADAGANWTTLTTNSTGSLQGIHFYDANNGIAVGLSGEILHTSNGGASWTSVTSGTTEHLRDVRMLSATGAIVIGDGGTILKNSNLGTSSLVEEQGIEISIYPNPASDITAISANINGNISNARIVLTNIVGQVVEVIYEGEILQGHKNFFFDATIYAAGMYQVLIQSDDFKVYQKVVIE